MEAWRGTEWKSSGTLPISGSAPVVPWFISTPPPQGGGLSVSRLCVQEDELGLQTHHSETLSFSVVLSLPHFPT